jgi:hypothetical protein
MCKLLGKSVEIARPLLYVPTLILLLSTAFFLALPETASAQIWVSSGFIVTPSTTIGVSGITFTPGNKTETAFCSTSAVDPTTSQNSPAAADYKRFLASCTVTPSTGAAITSTECPGGASGSVLNYPYGNPTGQCTITFQPQPDVTYTVTSTHALEFTLDPYGTTCGQWQNTACFSDPLGYYSMDPNAANPWPAKPTYTGVSSDVSLLATNTVDETCDARGGTCAPQNIPSEYCKSSIYGICNNSIIAPEYWYLAQTSEPWKVKCSDVVQDSVTPQVSGPVITATFTPNFGYTLTQAEQVCGFTDFNWQQTITALPTPSPFKAVGNSTPLSAPPHLSTIRLLTGMSISRVCWPARIYIPSTSICLRVAQTGH